MKKILFITFDDFSNINSSLHKQLLKHFPEYVLDTLVLKSELKKDYVILAGSVLSVFKEYFNDFIKGHKSIGSWRKYLYQTPFIMRFFNREISGHLKSDHYDFIFQTQSFFDSANETIPNFIYTDHTNLNNLNYQYIDPKQYLTTPAFLKLEQKIYDGASLMFVMSANIEDSLVHQYKINPDKIKLVYVGSNTSIRDDVDFTKYSNKNILFVGKDWERKGGPLLIEAFRIVQRAIPEATLTIIGCNPKVTLKNCFITGDIPLQDVSEYYNKASVFCLPTKREPFGIVFIEAMLNRLPVVTNSVGATPELIINNENGFRLNYDAKEYAEALIKLLNDPALCKRFGNHSYEIAREKYTWDHVGELISININQVLMSQSVSKFSQTSV